MFLIRNYVSIEKHRKQEMNKFIVCLLKAAVVAGFAFAAGQQKVKSGEAKVKTPVVEAPKTYTFKYAHTQSPKKPVNGLFQRAA